MAIQRLGPVAPIDVAGAIRKDQQAELAKLQLQQGFERVNREKLTRELTGRALGGDTEALNSLKSVNPDAFFKIRSNMVAEATRKNDIIARVANAADTPEKWARAMQFLKNQGLNPDPKELNFANRPFILSRALKFKDQLSLANQKSTLDLSRQRLGLERERLDLSRSAQADTKSLRDRELALKERRAGVGPVELTRRQETVKRRVKDRQEIKGRARGAVSFKRKIAGLRKLIKDAGDGAFGLIEGSIVGRTAKQIGAGVPLLGSNAKRITNLQTRIQSALRDLELDVARFKLKGQGPVTDSERKIARETLPSLSNPDTKAALDILDRLEREANETIAFALDGNAPQGGNQPARFKFNPVNGKLEPVNK